MKASYRSALGVVLALSLASTVSAETLSPGMSGEAVRSLQESLVAAGYLARTVDGEYGSTTREAVSLFQEDKALTVTGEADDATRAAIAAAAGHSWREGGGVVYAEGNRGDVITTMQRQLSAAGYLSEVDGVYGGATTDAVKRFQADRGLPISGAIDEETYTALGNKVIEKAPETHYRGSSWGEGDRDPAIAGYQRTLISLGYLKGDADGVFGADTSRAVMAFQRHVGIDADGKIGNDTIYALNHALPAGPAKEAPQPATHYRGSSWGEGDKDPAIVEIQAKLRILGYLEGPADGVFGKDTSEAVQQFQKDSGLTADGKVGNDTLYALRHTKPVKKPADKPAPAAEKKSNSAPASWGEGDRGRDIETIQEKLKRLGYLEGAADGVFGDDTSQAVMAFQRDAGLDVDGKVGNATLSALDRYRPKSKRTGAKKNGALSLGDRGKQVIRLQNNLLLHGYDPGTVDGVYGQSTADAVRKLQAEENLAKTGSADGDVWDRLSSAPRFTGKYKKVFHMRATAYTPYDGGGSGHTALGNYAGKGHAAVDPNVIPLGSIVYIEGYGYALCDDIGGAIHGNIIDVGVDTLDQAYEWGSKSRVNVYLIR